MSQSTETTAAATEETITTEEDVTLPSDVVADPTLAGETKEPAETKEGSVEETKEPAKDPAEDETEETSEEAPETTLSEEDQTATKDLYGDAIGGVMIKANLVGADVSKEYAENGTLTDEQFKSFDDAGFPKKLVEATMAGLVAQAQGAVDAQEAFNSEMRESVGGAEAFDKKVKWFSETATNADIKDYNEAVNGDSSAAAKLAVKNMDLLYEKANGKTPKLLNTENGSSSGGQSYYRSMEEVVKDMGDPNYNTSKAYQRKIDEKIARSTQAGFLKK